MPNGPRLLAALLLVSSVPTTALAWGPDGHRIIGEIASHYLIPRAGVEVERLLEAGRFDSLAEVGHWADSYARRFDSYDWAAKLHYVDVDPEASSFDAARDCPQGECVVGAIERFTTRLREPGVPLPDRREAFRFLVHFIEDVHNPLHVIHPDMSGGGLTPVTFLGEETELHELWDSLLIERRLRDLEAAGGDCVEPWRRLAYELRLGIDDAERIAWAAETSPAAWADEGIAPARALTFDVEPGAELGEAYYAAAIPVVERRLQMAAVRLAAQLNRLLGGE